MTTERKAIFISGAGAGIGRAAAERFAAEGWFVGLYGRTQEPLIALRDQLGAENALAGPLDVTDPASWTSALAEFWEQAGERLDVLLNNAGVIVAGPLAEQTPEAHSTLIDTNVKGVIYGAHAAHRYLKATPSSRLINMSSASALYGQPDIATYSASKFAIAGLTEALDLEWSHDGIRAYAISPLWVKTALADAAASTKSTSSLGVRLTPEDVAAAIWQAANYSGPIPRVHWNVGLPAQVMAVSAKLAPQAVTRTLVGWLSR